MPAPTREWRPPGPVDLALECLADDDLDALLSVVGVTGPAQRLDGVLPAEPLTAHLLTPTDFGVVPVEVDLPVPALNADVLARTPAGIVQLEFIVDRVPPDLGLDLLDYWIRLREQDREVLIEQFAVVLGDGLTVPDCFEDSGMSFSWTVVPIADLDPASLLRYPTTAAIAPLARGTPAQRTATLTAAAEVILRVEPHRRDVLLGAAVTLASIVLPEHAVAAALGEPQR